jgi:hypothetical protein
MHHFCGRPYPDGPYYNGIVLSLCKKCHVREHMILRRLRVEWPQPGADPLAHQVTRLTVTLGRLADEHRPLVLDVASTNALHELLIEVADRFASRLEAAS